MSTQPICPSPSNPMYQYGSKIESSPSTKIFQHNFKGTSNVYAPAIYYNVEKFVPLNSFDDYYASY
jgi:hypothetical protein